MKVNGIRQNTSFKGALQSKVLKKTLEFAANNGALCSASACVGLSLLVRPWIIMATPKAKKEDKQMACMRSISSGILGLGVMSFVSIPISNAVKNIEKEPQKYLKPSTIRHLKSGKKLIEKGKPFQFVGQMVKLSSMFLSIPPKAFLTAALIPPLLSTFFKKKDDKITTKNNIVNINSIKNIKPYKFSKSSKNISFKGFTNILSKGIGKFSDINFVQKFAIKHQNSNLPQHMFALGDMTATGFFIHYTNKSKTIDEKRKKTLNYNSAISTVLATLSGYGINRILKKPTKTFIDKFARENKDDKKLHKYIEGIKVIKPIIILGTLYYFVAPFVSTILADRLTKKHGEK